MTFGSLFAGIGGFDLGLERAGLTCRWQIEIDPFCRQVLARHWPDVLRYADIRTLDGRALPAVDLLCGGFPCQDLSFAGFGAGLAGSRSGLWRDYWRIIRDVRPHIVLVENVPALLIRGIDVVLGDLAGLGFDAEWACLSACSLGAAHPRQRLFVVAYANSEHGWPRFRDSIAHAFRSLQIIDGFESARARTRARLADPSALYRNADGVSFGLQRNRAIGNAVYPDVAEWLGRRILEAYGEAAACD